MKVSTDVGDPFGRADRLLRLRMRGSNQTARSRHLCNIVETLKLGAHLRSSSCIASHVFRRYHQSQSSSTAGSQLAVSFGSAYLTFAASSAIALAASAGLKDCCQRGQASAYCD